MHNHQVKRKQISVGSSSRTRATRYHDEWKYGPSSMPLEDIWAIGAGVESSMLHSFGYVEAALLAICCLLVIALC